MNLEARVLQLLEDVGIEAGQVVLDFGCGSGTYAIPAARIVGKEAYPFRRFIVLNHPFIADLVPGGAGALLRYHSEDYFVAFRHIAFPSASLLSINS